MIRHAPDGSFEFSGELFVSADGDVWGYCLDRSRPDLRCWVEVLMEDRLVATLLAARTDEDLAARGVPDAAHGFRGNVARAAWPDRPDILVWARVQGAKAGFAQTLLARPLVMEPAGAPEVALATRIADLSETLATLCDRVPRRGAAWRACYRAAASTLAKRNVP